MRSSTTSNLHPAQFELFRPNNWVRLRQPLSAYSPNEALLLCEEAEDSWVAWVPDLGEVRLHRYQFSEIEDD